MSSSDEINIDEEEEVHFYDDKNTGYDEESVYAEIAAYEEASKVQSDLLYIHQNTVVDIPWETPHPSLPKIDRPTNYASLFESHNLIEVNNSDDESYDDDTEDESDDDDDDDDDDDFDAMKDNEIATERGRKARTSIIVEDAAMAMPWLTEDEDGFILSTGPPKTKNEVVEDLLVVEDLSEIVINVNIDRLELIGEVLYTLDTEHTIIVQAFNTNNPFNEGSVLCNKGGEILGKINEVFGPVTSPFYTVRVDNRKTDVKTFYHTFQPKTEIYCIWKLSSFVTPALLMQRGTDASNMYDEEITEEQEFSDDEKELEAKQAKNKAAKQKQMPTMKAKQMSISNFTLVQPPPPSTAPILTIPNNMMNNNTNDNGYQQALPWAGFQQQPPAPQLSIQFNYKELSKN